jgi:CBS domain-containing protein
MAEKVRDYMILHVEHVAATATVGEAIDQLIRSRHHGFPVVDEGNRLVGFVSAKELLRHADQRGLHLRNIIKPGTYTATPEMALDDAARVLFRYGIRDLPVVDDQGVLVGLIANLDVVRSHFERATPVKADTLRKLLNERYGFTFTLRRGQVPLDRVKPTQWKVYEDELEGRRYELERGFAEPVLAISKGEEFILVDGHHRALAARDMGLHTLQAFILACDSPEDFAKVEIGLERIAKEHHLASLDDIEVDRSGHHPLIEVTTQLIRRFEGEKESRVAAPASETPSAPAKGAGH